MEVGADSLFKVILMSSERNERTCSPRYRTQETSAGEEHSLAIESLKRQAGWCLVIRSFRRVNILAMIGSKL
ncbi:hypothetical protein GOBAR_AA09043 [Gossypium barbadense]|uniref:Uncharacterized protein n=1 Tax=Gossypium barbadense TaxID=3634 RepID=A0A2P5Y7S8_GOSBA|nr:hypothetical protein GOBAR_AA09043 [Gossypium barbadense]